MNETVHRIWQVGYDTDGQAEEARAMANEEHLTRLKQGVDAWNQWRDETHVWPDLTEANLTEANLSEANLSCAFLYRAILVKANLSEANLSEANLSEANLSEANLSEANLSGADLTGADLTGADLTGANLHRADLTEANLTEANLSWASLTHADLTEANLTHADLHKAAMAFTTVGNVDLSKVQRLETVDHGAPSTIGIDTLYRSQGNIPEVFLRGAGVPDDMITYMKSLVGRPFEFYSCFISYSSKDQEFAERLYADLQGKKVRGWFAPEDLKIGEKFRTGIDEAIRVHDKLLLVLSDHSVTSDWVEMEVEAAFEEERRRKKTILFPIRLDDSVSETHQAWAANIRRTRHIGDFRQWKEHDAYQKAFQRLLRDLKADI